MDMPPSFSFKGAGAKSLKSQARQIYTFVLNQFKLGGTKSLNRKYVLTDGSVISIFIVKEDIHSTIKGYINIVAAPLVDIEIPPELYLESGFYDLVSSAKCSEGTAKPAILHYNSPIQAYINSLDKPIQGLINSKLLGEKLPDGYVSKSVGGNLTTSFSDSCGNYYNSYTGSIYSKDYKSILRQKQIQNRIPSSLFSGKLRLYIQAIYGSKRADYWINLDDNGLPKQADYDFYLENDNKDLVKIEWGYPDTCGLFTTEKLDYYLIIIHQNTVDLYPLKLIGGAQGIRNVYLNSDLINDFIVKSKIEAYLLGQAVISKDKITIPIESSSTFGEPLAYGWKFSESGKEARIVLNVDISGNRTAYEATEFILKIDHSEGTFKATMSKGMVGKWSHNAYFVPWVPDYFWYSQIMEGLYNYSMTFSTNGIAPLYGYYEGEEYTRYDLIASIQNKVSEPHPIIYEQVNDLTYDQDLGPFHYGTQNGSNGIINLYKSGESIVNLFIKSKSSDNILSYYWAIQNDSQALSDPGNNGGLSVSDIYRSSGSREIMDKGMNGISYAISKGWWQQSGPYHETKWSAPVGGFQSGVGILTRNATLRYNLRARSGVNDTGKISLIIPLLDSERVIVAQRVSETSSSETYYTGAIGGNSWTTWDVQFVNVSKNISTGNITITGLKEGPLPVIHIAEFTFDNGGVLGTYTGPKESANLKIMERNNGNLLQSDDNYDIKVTSGVGTSAWITPYTDGILYLPLTNPIISKSSFNGANIVYHSITTNIPSGITTPGENNNGYINKNAVGWA